MSAITGHLRQRYGASPVHLIAHLIGFAIAAYALVVVAGGLQNALFPADHCGQARDVLHAYPRYHVLAVVTVAFQGHYSRFVDMAPGNWSPSSKHVPVDPK